MFSFVGGSVHTASDIYENRDIDVPRSFGDPRQVHPFGLEFEEIVRHDIHLGAAGSPIYVGRNTSPRRCRVCLRPEGGGVTFRKEAHIIAQGWGNRELRSTEECDDCNANFGRTIDQDFLNYTAPWRAFSPHKTRSGGFKLKRGGGTSFIKNGDGSGMPEVFIDDAGIRLFRAHSDTLVLLVEVEPYSPMGVAKALARMGFMLLPPEELASFDHVRRWLLGEVEHQPIITMVAVPGGGDAQVQIAIYRRRKPLVGLCPLVVEFIFGNLGWYWHAPTLNLKTPSDAMLPTIRCSPTHPYVPRGFRKFVKAEGRIAKHPIPMHIRPEEVLDGGDPETLRRLIESLPWASDLPKERD